MKGNMTGFVKPLLLILAVVAAVVILAFAAASMMGGNKELGQAIDFTATDTSGNSVTLSKQSGSVALVFFNRAQSDGKTLLTNLAAATEGTEVKILLIAIGEQNGKEIDAYLAENNLHADIVIPDPKEEIAALYNVTACPITYFIDTAGMVRGVSLSNLTPSAAAKYIGYIR